DPIEFRNLTPRCPTFDCFNYSHTQILRIRLRHWLPQIESMSYIRSLTSTWESIRFNPTGKCSKNRKRCRVLFSGALPNHLQGKCFGETAPLRRPESSAASAKSHSRHALIFGSIDVACGETIQ